MLPRALLSFLPGIFALAFLSGTPAAGVAGKYGGATSWSIGAASAAGARGQLTPDRPFGFAHQSADEDDAPDDRITRIVADDDDAPDDRVVRTVTVVVWPAFTLPAIIPGASDVVGPTHRPCAAPPRAPPIV